MWHSSSSSALPQRQCIRDTKTAPKLIQAPPSGSFICSKGSLKWGGVVIDLVGEDDYILFRFSLTRFVNCDSRGRIECGCAESARQILAVALSRFFVVIFEK